MVQYQDLVKTVGLPIYGQAKVVNNVVINPRPSFHVRLPKKLQDFSYETNKRYCDGLMYELEKEKENAMKTYFKKREFLKLKIIGQFNKGFIVCTLNK